MSISKLWCAVFALLVVFSSVWIACGDDDDDDDIEDIEEDPTPPTPEQILENLTGYRWSLSAGDLGIQTPDRWNFLFAVYLNESQASLMDGGWRIDFRSVKNALAKVGYSMAEIGLDFSGIRNQIVFAKIQNTHGGDRLLFSNKLSLRNEIMRIDEESTDDLGAGGDKGFGWYIAYYSSSPFGFVSGSVVPCDGDDVTRVTVTATDAPFFARPDANGNFALAVLGNNSADPDGLPVSLFFQGTSCMGVSSAVMTDAIRHPNPKCDALGLADDCATTQSRRFSDDTVAVGPISLDMNAEGFRPGAADESCDNCDFESGNTNGWSSLAIGGTETAAGCFGVASAGRAELFPDSTQSRYAFLTTGGEGLSRCVAYRTLVVPDDVTKLQIKYDLATQEYDEYIGSPYADVFAVALTDAYGFMVNRTVNNIATAGDFVAVPDAAAEIAGIAQSADAEFNPTGRRFDGHLAWSSTGDVPRGGPSSNNVGSFASWTVTPGETVTIIMSVSDSDDTAFDTAALIDEILFN